MKMFTIIKKEYKLIVKKKSFIISTLLTPALIAGFIFLPVLLMKVGKGVKTIDVADYSNTVGKEFVKVINKTYKKHFKIKSIDTKKDKNKLIEEYKSLILDRKIDGLLIIPKDIKESRTIMYYASNVSDFEFIKLSSNIIRNLLSRKILIEKNIDPQIVNDATKDIYLVPYKVKKEGISKSSSGAEYTLSIIMLSILFTIIMTYGQLIMRGVLEEKNNRIVEILISSVNYKDLFFGKILGIGLAGLTQVLLWVVLGTALIGKFGQAISATILNILTLELGLYFIIFFIIGYFMFSVLFSIVGASVNTDQEAQQFAAPITYLMIIPFIMGIIVTQNPNTPLVIGASLFPLFTPTLMFMRITVSMPPMIQVWGSIAGSILFTILLMWFSAKIFRTGILMYGKKPTIKEMLKWLKYK